MRVGELLSQPQDLLSLPETATAMEAAQAMTEREVMTREVFSVGPDHLVDRVRIELQRRHIRHLPVVVDGRLVGVLSLRDILRADLDKMSHEVEALENYSLGGTEPQA